MERNVNIERRGDYWIGRFSAMASPCEILLEVDTHATAERLVKSAAREAWRIEEKFSRYRNGNIIHRINNAGGKPIEVDAETANLLDFANKCYHLSDGLFDITSGVLRKLWNFKPEAAIPSQSAIDQLLPNIGWSKVAWQRPILTLAAGMEIDLGGLGKEYAVDRCAQLLRQHVETSWVVNFGGDLYIGGLRRSGERWRIGIDDPRNSGKQSIGELSIERGGLTTSGDARRFIEVDGVRYSHILNPRTGWPVAGAPHSVTVVAETCMEAGMLSTFAMLQGSEARDFLQAQGVPFWVS